MPSWIVQEEDVGLTLFEFLKKKLDSSYSNKKLKYFIDHNSCLVNGRVESIGSLPVRIGVEIVLHIDNLNFEKQRILFEDSELLIYDKPPFITSVGDKASLEQQLKTYVADLRAIHRLDRDTSGVIIFAKTALTHSYLIDQFKQHRIKKNYLALIHGIPSQNHGEIENYVAPISKSSGSITWGVVSECTGLQAKTEWKIEKKGARHCLLDCSPITGRTHQIRLHLSHFGYPIVGDPKYGRNLLNHHIRRTMLHAHTIEFLHPKTDQSLKITAPIPLDFKKTINDLIDSRF